MKYKLIAADPPWGEGVYGPKISNHYPLMTTQQIAALDVPSLAADDAVLVLWVTWRFVPDALTVIKAWGFEYVAGFPWIKSQYTPAVNLFGDLQYKASWGLGGWVRGCSEPVFIAKRGDAKPPKADWLGLITKREVHSKKPESIYDYCESLPGPYLEMFARRRRDGWDVFGNEVEGSIAIPTRSDYHE